MAMELTLQQTAAKELIQSDLHYLYTVYRNIDTINSNYIVSMMPYLSLIIDGAESWVAAMNNAKPGIIDAPRFTREEKQFYDATRQSIKLWEMSFEEVSVLLEERYKESDAYFSSLCKPVAKRLNLYDIFGADITDDGHFCGNTILAATYLPGYNHGDSAYGPGLRDLAVIGGKYISLFDAKEEYEVCADLKFQFRDYGGFEKSPVGNAFSYRFVLFSLLCQVNFILYAVDKFIVPEIPAKLRFAYILYYYLCDMLPQINATFGTNFHVNRKYYSQDFRNAMAHYKVGVYLREKEIIPGDPMFGMTQKAYGMDFYYMKKTIVRELKKLSDQVESYLKFK